MISPGTPLNFGNYKIWYRYKSATYEINIQRKSNASSLIELTLDGMELGSNRISLADDGKQHIVHAVF